MNTIAAGLSMGGDGAFTRTLTHPGRFAAAASLSGALRPDHLRARSPAGVAPRYTAAFGAPADFPGSGNDLVALARKVSASTRPSPGLFHCFGTEDFLVEANRVFRNFLCEAGRRLTCGERKGDHIRAIWDDSFQRVLAWLRLGKPSA